MRGSANLAEALRCAELLGPVLPCCWPAAGGACGCGRRTPHMDRDVGKAPLTSHGVDDASRDRGRIAGWWSRWPEANVAVALEPAGLLLVDPDSERALLEAAAWSLPPTLVRISRNPAYLYRRPPGAPIGAAIRRGASGRIDVMSCGYVVAFGRHRSGCEVYLEWLCPPQDAPEWPIRLLADSIPCEPVALPSDLQPVSLAGLRVAGWVRRLVRFGRAADPERYASRSEALWAAIRALVRAGHDDATIAAALLDPHNAAGEKAREQGRKWLAGEIGRARKKPRNGVDLAEGLPAVSGMTAPLVRRLPTPRRPKGVPLPTPGGPGRAA